jgi:hypothetical protein
MIIPQILFISPFTGHIITLDEEGTTIDLTAMFRVQELRDWKIHDNMPSVKRAMNEKKARAEAEEVFKRYRDWVNQQEIEGITKGEKG